MKQAKSPIWRAPSLRLTDSGFELVAHQRDGVLWRETRRLVEWTTVTRVVGLKTDCTTVDCIWFWIYCGSDSFGIYEDMEGFHRVVEAMSRTLEGFMEDWHTKVAFPPFEPCEIVAYER